VADEPEETEDEEVKDPKAGKRSDELATTAKVKEKLADLYVDVAKGYENQRGRTDDILDNWDLYNCQLGEKQFYSGNSKIFIPFVKDAVDARVTRFVNQMFPNNGRYVEITTGEGDPPYATQALIEGYIRNCRMRTRVMPALMRNGDVEGQYTIYVSWKDTKRAAMYRVKKQPMTDGLPNEAAEPVDDIEEEEIVDSNPDVEVISDADLLVLPVTVDSIEEALDAGGSATIMRRWTKGKIKALIAAGEIDEEAGEALIEAMSAIKTEDKIDTSKEQADAAGIKKGGKEALVYETWHMMKVGDDIRLCRIYFGGEDRILSCRRNPYWNDRCPILSAPVDKVSGVFKGRAPVGDVADLQIFANDTINEGADTAHYSAMPIIMSDPLKNPRVDTMVLSLGALWETSPQDTKIVEFPDLWRSALERAGHIKEQIFQTLGVNPAMVPQQTGGAKKRNQAEIANEQQVDILTTADAVTNVEQEILTPVAQRFVEYDHQFRDEEITIRVYGEPGMRANMEQVEPIQLNKRFDIKWYGVQSARNAAQMQQKIAWVNVVMKLPPTAYPDYTLDLAPMIVEGTEDLFGAKLGPQIFKRKSIISVDPHIEDQMMEHGFRTAVHPADDDLQHIQDHIAAVQEQGDPHGTFREHIELHQHQMQDKAAAAAKTQQPGGGGGGGSPAGAMPTMPRQGKGPPGGIRPDSMPAAGAVPMPRKM
jgi:hypothetical protein